jgi:hypothetical protein
MVGIRFSSPENFHVRTLHLENFHEPCNIELGVQCKVVNVGDEVCDLPSRGWKCSSISSKLCSSPSSSEPSSTSLPCASCAAVSATPDLSEDEEVADYDNVLGYLPIYEGAPYGHHRTRSR